jgi:type IV pilus assembly protein PilV
MGFTLVEVLVALIVISIGLLGVAKLQALALSSTGIAGKRSMAALEAAGIASAIHADRGYWSAITTNTIVTATGTSFTSTDPLLAPGPTCLVGAGAPCSAADMASSDLVRWATSALSTLGTGYKGTIFCRPAVTVLPEIPASCRITLNWAENIVVTDSTQALTAPTIQNPQYILFVTP